MVTIALPIYNVSKYISQCLDSLQKQSYSNIEFLLIPDKCTDNSVAVANDFIKNNGDCRFKMLAEPPVQLGISRIRNLAIKLAKGDYLIFVDSDDKLTACAVENLIDVAVSAECDFVIGSYRKVDIYGRIISNHVYNADSFNSNESILEHVFNSRTKASFHFASWAKLYKLSYLRENKIECLPDVLLDDWVLSYLLYLNSKCFCVTNRIVYEYTSQRPGSVVNKNDYNETILTTSWLSLYNFYINQLYEAINNRQRVVLPFLVARLYLILSKLRKSEIEKKKIPVISLLRNFPIRKDNISYLIRFLFLNNIIK